MGPEGGEGEGVGHSGTSLLHIILKFSQGDGVMGGKVAKRYDDECDVATI